MAAQFIPTPGDRGGNFLSGVLQGMGAVGAVGEFALNIKKAALTNTLLESDIQMRQQKMQFDQQQQQVLQQLSQQELKTGEQRLQHQTLQTSLLTEFGRTNQVLNQQLLTNQVEMSKLGVTDATYESTEKQRLTANTQKVLAELSANIDDKVESLAAGDPAVGMAAKTMSVFAKAGDAKQASTYMGMTLDLISKNRDLVEKSKGLKAEDDYRNALFKQNYVDMAVKNPEMADSLLANPGVMLSGVAPILKDIAAKSKAGAFNEQQKMDFYNTQINQAIEDGDPIAAATFAAAKMRMPQSSTTEAKDSFDMKTLESTKSTTNSREYSKGQFDALVKRMTSEINKRQAGKAGKTTSGTGTTGGKNDPASLDSYDADLGKAQALADSVNAPIARTAEELADLKRKKTPRIVDATDPKNPKLLGR